MGVGHVEGAAVGVVGIPHDLKISSALEKGAEDITDFVFADFGCGKEYVRLICPRRN